MSYLGIFLGMTLESSFFPFPSEVILIPAGTLISQGQLSFVLVFTLAILGSIAGALINYSIALYVGRYTLESILKKRKRFLLISENSLKKADTYFNKHGEITTFVGRLIPGVRQLISLPAGFARMNLFKFSLFTLIGSALWSFILILFGYFIGKNSLIISQNSSWITWIFLLMALIVALI